MNTNIKYKIAAYLSIAFILLGIVRFFKTGVVLNIIATLIFLYVFLNLKLLLNDKLKFHKTNIHIIFIICSRLAITLISIYLFKNKDYDYIYGLLSAVQLILRISQGIVAIRLAVVLRQLPKFSVLPSPLSSAFTATGILWITQILIPYTGIISRRLSVILYTVQKYAGFIIVLIFYVLISILFLKASAKNKI